MAIMSPTDYAALTDGFEEGQRAARAFGRAQYVNPHPWGTRLHRIFEFGYHVQEKGLTLGARDYWQIGRGLTFVSPAGHTVKSWCSKTGMGFQRVA